jgi:hypothetical protein
MSNLQIIKNMPAEEYYALERFSYSGIKQIMTSSQDYWKNSFMNKDKEEKKSESFFLGTAYHASILEGDKVFNERFAIKPDVDKRTKEGKAVYALLEAEKPNCKFISEEDYNDIQNSLAKNSNIFVDGDPEVSVLWDDDDTGVPMKARIDYLKEGKILDLKTFNNTSGGDINNVISKHIANYGYYIQRALYGDLEPFKDYDFEFVFQQVGGINNCRIVNMPNNLLLVQKGRDIIKKGIRKFANNYKRFGTNEWVDDISSLTVDDNFFPLYIFD